MIKSIYVLCACFFLALAVIGIVLPGVPTVPFLLLSAWFASKGSKRMHDWMYRHKTFGKILKDWDEQRAVPRRCKVIAVLMMCCSWSYLYFTVEQKTSLIGVSVFFLIGMGYLLTRPEPKTIDKNQS
jgi:uncharacterized membrane protein YbaN (DUF454 family)